MNLLKKIIELSKKTKIIYQTLQKAINFSGLTGLP
jgi:hypothetical protein